jgi:hypothetical protein
MLASPPKTAPEVLTELLEHGYALSVRTRVEVTDHKVGSQHTTYADKLYVEGPEPLPGELRHAITEHREELLAAACILNPPVSWLETMIRRYRAGVAAETKRMVPYRKRDGTVGLKTAPVAASITPETIANNVAVFIGLHPARDGERLLPIIQEVLENGVNAPETDPSGRSA